MYVKSFKELEVYKLARKLAYKIFLLTKKFPKEEKYSLTDQIRRSSRSVGANVAEAWGKRRYEAHFISKLTDSDAEQLETQHWLDNALECEYITKIEADKLVDEYLSLGRMLNSMINKANKFCGVNKHQ